MTIHEFGEKENPVRSVSGHAGFLLWSYLSWKYDRRPFYGGSGNPQRNKVHIQYGIIGSSDFDQSGRIKAAIMTALITKVKYHSKKYTKSLDISKKRTIIQY